MKRNESYALERLSGVPYLIPCGQPRTDSRHAIRLNETGAFLWGILKDARSTQELLDECAAHYHASAEERIFLEKDIQQFLDALSVSGAIIKEWVLPRVAMARDHDFKIAGLGLRIHGMPEFIPEPLFSFSGQLSDEPRQTVVLCPIAPADRRNGQLLIRNEELAVLDAGDRYLILFPSQPGLFEMHLRKDGAEAILYYLPSAATQEQVSQALRISFFYLAALEGHAALHSASILYRGKAWLFSAPSGTGKSTHAKLWSEHFRAPVLNGDLNLISFQGEPTIQGIPWCGTSGIYDTETYPLGGIILLQQALENRVEELSPEEQLLLVQQRLITPCWTPAMLEGGLGLLSRILPRVLVCRLLCTEKPGAAMASKGRIDRLFRPA